MCPKQCFFFGYFDEHCLTLLFLVPHWAGDNIDLPSDINISKTVEVNIAFIQTFLKNIQ